MIERLYNHEIVDRAGTIYGFRSPDNGEIVEKLNEIIDYLNGDTEGGTA